MLHTGKWILFQKCRVAIQALQLRGAPRARCVSHRGCRVNDPIGIAFDLLTDVTRANQSLSPTLMAVAHCSTTSCLWPCDPQPSWGQLAMEKQLNALAMKLDLGMHGELTGQGTSQLGRSRRWGWEQNGHPPRRLTLGECLCLKGFNKPSVEEVRWRPLNC